MSIESKLPFKYRKPFYHRVTEAYQYTPGGIGESIRWREWSRSDELVDYDGFLELKDKDQQPLPVSENSGSFGGLTTPKGVTHLQNGIVLAIDRAHQRLICYSPAIHSWRPLWRQRSEDDASPYSLRQPIDLLFSNKNELVVCDAGKRQVIWYQWPTLQVKHIFHTETEIPNAITQGKNGSYLIGLNTPPESLDDPDGRIIRIGARFQHLETVFIPNHKIGHVDALTTLKDERVLILRHQASTPESASYMNSEYRVWCLDDWQWEKVNGHWRVNQTDPIESLVDLNGIANKLPPLILREGELFQPNLFFPDCEAGLLKQSGIDRKGYITSEYGEGSEKSVSRIAIVTVSKRIRMKKSRRLISPPIEGDSDQFRWDRLVFQTRVLPNTSLVIQTKTSDRLLTDSEITGDFQQPWSTAIRLDSTDRPHVLVQSLPGRFLYLSIEFYGDGYSSTKIEAVNIEGPRQSSLQWLPPVYHQDNESRHFLDRFLSYFDLIFDQLGYQSDHFARYLSPFTVPDEAFLNWLASWFHWDFFPDTPVDKKRQIISELMVFYRQRGTMNGLKQLLRWYTGLTAPFPQIIEHYAFERYLGKKSSVVLAGKKLLIDDMDASKAHRFTVVLPLVLATSASRQERFKQMVAAQKPAHTVFDIAFIDSKIVVGCQSRVGVDMIVGRRELAVLDETELGVSSILNKGKAASFHNLSC